MCFFYVFGAHDGDIDEPYWLINAINPEEEKHIFLFFSAFRQLSTYFYLFASWAGSSVQSLPCHTSVNSPAKCIHPTARMDQANCHTC